MFLKSGIHPTIAGVLLAFTIPIRQKIDINTFVENLKSISKNIIDKKSSEQLLLSKDQMEQIDNLEELTEKFHSPLQHLEHKLHNWIAYFIMPVFALANSGVVFNADMDLNMPLIINIAIALFIGKFIGITLLSLLSVKLKIAQLPDNINYWQIVGISILAGVGFTMSIFIANLAFTENLVFIDSAKIGIIIGSLISGIIGYLILKFNRK